MTLDEPIHSVETALNDLRKVASGTNAWSDRQRSQFDSERMQPLDRAGTQLIQAMQRAQEQLQQAERLLS